MRPDFSIATMVFSKVGASVIVRDRVDLGELLLHALFDRGLVVAVLDLVEGRRVQRQIAHRGKGIGRRKRGRDLSRGRRRGGRCLGHTGRQNGQRCGAKKIGMNTIHRTSPSERLYFAPDGEFRRHSSDSASCRPTGKPLTDETDRDRGSLFGDSVALGPPRGDGDYLQTRLAAGKRDMDRSRNDDADPSEG